VTAELLGRLGLYKPHVTDHVQVAGGQATAAAGESVVWPPPDSAMLWGERAADPATSKKPSQATAIYFCPLPADQSRVAKSGDSGDSGDSGAGRATGVRAESAGRQARSAPAGSVRSSTRMPCCRSPPLLQRTRAGFCRGSARSSGPPTIVRLTRGGI
jgi:hypothetical protein